MFKRKWVIGLTVIVVFGLFIIVGRMALQPKNYVIEQEMKTSPTIECWIYTAEMEKRIHHFQKEYPQYSFDVRVFRSKWQLYEELSAAISANAPPQIAEISSLYGIPQLIEGGEIIPLDESTAFNISNELHPAFISPFLYKENIWAVPIGGEIPVIYYNEDLAGHVSLDISEFVNDGPHIVQAANKLTSQRNGNGVNEHWGLAIDTEVAWYLTNWATTIDESENLVTQWQEPLQFWHQLVFEFQVMQPLHHRFATSDFINGKVGMLISSSRKKGLIDRYIGGKFQYGLIPLPMLSGDRIVPDISGLAVIKSDPEKEELALNLVNYLISEDSQMNMFRNTGIISSRMDVMEQLKAEMGPETKERLLLDIDKGLFEKGPSGSDMNIMEALTEIIEQLESNPDANIEELAHKLEQIKNDL